MDKITSSTPVLEKNLSNNLPSSGAPLGSLNRSPAEHSEPCNADTLRRGKTVTLAQKQSPSGKPKPNSVLDRFGGRFLYISLFAHGLLALIATWFVVQRIEHKTKTAFKSGSTGQSTASRAIEHKVQVAKLKQTMSAPAQAKRITTNAVSARVAIPEVNLPMNSPVTPNRMAGAGGLGTSLGTLAMGGAGTGGGGGIPFFGLRINAKRIAFLIDYSGTMTPELRAKLEKELQHSLEGLPRGTQVIIMPWAGGAWLYNQSFQQVSHKWKCLGSYDNFARTGDKLETPTWIALDPDKIASIMKHVKGQKNVSGGTDWRSPFTYIMEANPAPDVICFITDGQIPPGSVHRAMETIDKELKKAQRLPVVNCFWIRNKAYPAEPMKKLAKKYNGAFSELGD